MSSSRGNVFGVAELVEVVPPEVLRYFVLRARPSRRITFDPGGPLLQLVDEVDRAGDEARGALHYARVGAYRPLGVPFRHLVLVGQITGFDLDATLERLEKGGYSGLDRAALAERLEMARRWLERFAPPDARVTMPERLPEAARGLDPEARRFLERLAPVIESLDDGERIQQAIRELAEGPEGPGMRAAFRALYRALLGRDTGPRAGTYIALLGPRRVAQRLREAARGGAGEST